MINLTGSVALPLARSLPLPFSLSLPPVPISLFSHTLSLLPCLSLSLCLSPPLSPPLLGLSLPRLVSLSLSLSLSLCVSCSTVFFFFFFFPLSLSLLNVVCLLMAEWHSEICALCLVSYGQADPVPPGTYQ